MSTTLELACNQAAQFESALKNAGRPAPPKLPKPEQTLSQDDIVLIASRGRRGMKYLSGGQRRDIFSQIMALDLPESGTMKLNNISDVRLCRLWMLGHSLAFVREAYPDLPCPPRGPRLVKRFR